MNPIENEQIAARACQCVLHGAGRLQNFPGLIKKIIELRAWEERQIRTGEIVRLKSLAELITLPQLRGWNEDLKKIEALLKDDPEALAAFRKEIHGNQGQRTDLGNNITEVNERVTGTSRAYTLSRLKRESPELFAEVCDGKLSANAAAIKAGFRKKPTPEQQILKLFMKCQDKAAVLAALSAMLPAKKRGRPRKGS